MHLEEAEEGEDDNNDDTNENDNDNIDDFKDIHKEKMDDDNNNDSEKDKSDESWKQSVLTVSRFADGRFRSGLTWQQVGSSLTDGLLYGLVDSEGRFTGNNITFLYPDLRTGLHGVFSNGELVAGHEVRVVAARCRGGLKELLLADSLPQLKRTIWRREDINATWLGSWPRVVDPHERRAVFVAPSGIGGAAGEGLFARRSFLPGELISYLRWERAQGLKTGGGGGHNAAGEKIQ